MKLRIALCLVVALVTAAKAFSQELTVTATNANTVSSKTLIDLPGLTGNPLAIIVATPVGNTALLNTHPVGAWYYSGKWNIFNSDHAVMPLGAKYKVQFFKEPGPNQFMHLVTQQNLGAEGSYIDNPARNNNPNAQVKFNDICPATQRTAPLMTLTPGKALILDKTGHSLDNERKTFWARQIFEFLGLK